MSTPMSGAGRAQNGDEIRQWISRTLDKWQRSAVNAPEGPTFVFGPPGAGKSFTLRARVASLVASGVDAGKIVILTKTAAAAESFAATLRKIPGMDGSVDRMFIGTFQAYASSFMRLVGALAPGVPQDYSLWGPDQCLVALEQLAAEHPRDNGKPVIHRDLRRLLQWHSRNRSRRDLGPIPAPDAAWRQLADAYTVEKRRQNALDGDDLVDVFIGTLRDDPELRDAWCEHRAQHLLIDDFQDITPAQYELMQLLVGPEGSVAVAADRSSSIHSLGGGDRWMSEKFLMDHSRASRHHLPLNHRSTQLVSGLAVALQEAPGMPGVESIESVCIGREGAPPHLLVHDGPVIELDQQVLDSVRDRLYDDGYARSDVAFLYADAGAARRITAGLRARGIPCRDLGEPVGPVAPDLAAVQNLLALAVNPWDQVALRLAVEAGLSSSQHPKVGTAMARIGEESRRRDIDPLQAARSYTLSATRSTAITRRLEFVVDTVPILQAAMSQEGADAEAIIRLAFERFREQALSNPWPQLSADLQRLLVLVNTVADPSASPRAQLSSVLDHLAAGHDPMERSSWIDHPNGETSGITLCPIRLSTGREWPVVVLLDCVEGKMPAQFADGDEERRHEAQRQFYVACTRAKDILYICVPLAGTHCESQTPSRFIAPLAPVLAVQEGR